MGSLGVGGTTVDEQGVAAGASAVEIAAMESANATHPVTRMGPPPEKSRRMEAPCRGKGSPEGVRRG